MAEAGVVILGVYVADLAFWAERLPVMGETLLGGNFKIGPGGKGSNQAVAARRAGGDVAFISKVSDDEFGAMARAMYECEGIDQNHVYPSDVATGAAFIMVQEKTGENAIIIYPGAAETLTNEEVEAASPVVAGARVFVTQLELKMPQVECGLALARKHGVSTVLNPAPAMVLPDHIYPMVDNFTPNESEAAALAGCPVENVAQAEQAAEIFIARGVGAVLVTLGGDGVLVKDEQGATHIPAFDMGTPVDTTGAGDAFNGGFAVGLAENMDVREAARFGCAVGALSVTRQGTAPSMPSRDEVEELLQKP
ncbi:MAG: ribokinase [Rhodospirillales bacterium]|jgi:ribokinase|nr:ribokinase [Rhodospirillales bacterium]